MKSIKEMLTLQASLMTTNDKKTDGYVSQFVEKCATLKSEGKLNENSEIRQSYINERYLDSDSRQNVYGSRGQTDDSRGI